VRRERRGIRRYVHLGTGNYHAGTAALYTDLGLLTANPEIGEDVHRVFQQLSGLGRVLSMTHLLHSPFTLHKAILSKIKREAGKAGKGLPAGIDAKMNSLTEPKVIRALYSASQAGVPVRLLVRGVCCLRPGIPGVSENIRVRSVIGRFLEHARVYCFENGGDREVWCSSADWMERNLFQRVEVAFPILDRGLSKRVYEETIALPWKENAQAWDMQANGEYSRTTQAGQKKLRHPQQRLIRIHRA
jgi:polyphosphate kinase